MDRVDPPSNGRTRREAGQREATAERRRAAVALIEDHDATLRRTARRYSLCAEDSEDAYQRALEIALTKAPPFEGERLLRWMQTVTKHEALAVRRQRERLLNGRPADRPDEADPLDAIASEGPGPDARAARRERVVRSREALAMLKPQEVRALVLKAQGYSYAEIGRLTGWTHTKINRCMAEGRKRFLEAFAEIEQGARCEEMAAVLSGFADGEAGAGESDSVSHHLASCAHCRAQLRAFRGVPQRVLDLVPAGVAAEPGLPQRLAGRVGGAVERVRESALSVVGRGGGEVEGVAGAAATAGIGAKVAAICAGGAMAAGGACVAAGVVPSPLGPTEAPAEAPVAVERPVETPPSAASDSAPGEDRQPEGDVASTPEQVQQQATQQFTPLQSPAGGGGSSGGGQFGLGDGGGGGSGGGGGGGGGGQFGFER